MNSGVVAVVSISRSVVRYLKARGSALPPSSVQRSEVHRQRPGSQAKPYHLPARSLRIRGSRALLPVHSFLHRLHAPCEEHSPRGGGPRERLWAIMTRGSYYTRARRTTSAGRPSGETSTWCIGCAKSSPRRPASPLRPTPPSSGSGVRHRPAWPRPALRDRLLEAQARSRLVAGARFRPGPAAHRTLAPRAPRLGPERPNRRIPQMDRGELHLTGADLIATISGTDTAARVPLLSNPTPRFQLACFSWQTTPAHFFTTGAIAAPCTQRIEPHIDDRGIALGRSPRSTRYAKSGSQGTR